MDRSLQGRRIVLGVTGGVAAYKAAELCRELVRRGAWVTPVMTVTAERFLGAATLSALASEPTRTSLWEALEASPHTDLGQAADLVVVAPATANLLASARAGRADDLLTTLLLATRAPVVFAPAMHTEMWEHPATRDNVEVLRSRGATIVEPGAGELAGGDVGVGRLADVADILAAVELSIGAPADDSLLGLTVLVSAGGTQEPIDPVRYLGNRSSGRQGHAIAAAALARGARVHLVTTAQPSPEMVRAADVHRATTAQQLRERLVALAPAADIVVMAAAVADYRPVDPASHKLKRRDGVPRVELEPTPDILRELVASRPPGQTVVGFAAETDELDRNARAKLASTGVDLLVANDVSAPGAGFEHDTNAVTIFDATGAVTEVSLCSKRMVAERLFDEVLRHRESEAAPRLREVR
ncbi:MAG: phosphopantothenoylcysteine decarboxylase/phosphopantothenate--cysteine ligase [Thermoleophilia bacterium]|jgi:phosphopantothenoylcysteine decarboxylase/phosphopantothenate--cysteine ligase|nr:phosphopantothenoylcysteine decarboxylase/phosphopantothenate--cysteine ligase [Thermoleophilia bacterium]